MKLNNKGFAISTIMYLILALAIILIITILALLSSRKLILDKIKSDIATNISGRIETGSNDNTGTSTGTDDGEGNQGSEEYTVDCEQLFFENFKGTIDNKSAYALEAGFTYSFTKLSNTSCEYIYTKTADGVTKGSWYEDDDVSYDLCDDNTSYDSSSNTQSYIINDCNTIEPFSNYDEYASTYKSTTFSYNCTSQNSCTYTITKKYQLPN